MPTDELKERIQTLKELLGNGSVILPLRVEGWHKSLTDGGWFIRNALGRTLMTVEFVEAEKDSGRPALHGNAPARTIVGLLNAVPDLITELERLQGENEALTWELATACRHGQVLSEEVDRLNAAKKEIEEIAAGMADVIAGNTTPVEAVRRRRRGN
jgi:hypothetical protein